MCLDEGCHGERMLSPQSRHKTPKSTMDARVEEILARARDAVRARPSLNGTKLSAASHSVSLLSSAPAFRLQNDAKGRCVGRVVFKRQGMDG